MKNIFFKLFIFISIFVFSCSSDPDPENNNNPAVPEDVIEIYIDENPLSDTELAIIEAGLASENIGFTLTDNEPSGSLEINIENGRLIVSDSSYFNFELYPLITATANIFKQTTNENGQSTVELVRKTYIKVHLNDIYQKYSHIGNITLSSQEEVNEFGEENPWGVSGTLKIIGGDITDLSPISEMRDIGSLVVENFDYPVPNLNFIEEIIGSVIIEDNSGIVNLEFLPNFEYLEYNLKIINNDQLITLQGLPSQISIGRDFYISDNYLLESLNGIQNTTDVNWNLYISNNYSLENLSGIQNINNVGRILYISNNYSLENLNGIQNINQINGSIEITNNTYLMDISAISSISTIYGSIIISGNNYLSDLTGLENLTNVGNHFTIKNQAYIYFLDELENLQFVGGNFTIVNIPNLFSFCGITNLVTNGEIIGDYIVENNLYNPTQQDIIDGNCDL